MTRPNPNVKPAASPANVHLAIVPDFFRIKLDDLGAITGCDVQDMRVGWWWDSLEQDLVWGREAEGMVRPLSVEDLAGRLDAGLLDRLVLTQRLEAEIAAACDVSDRLADAQAALDAAHEQAARLAFAHQTELSALRQELSAAAQALDLKEIERAAAAQQAQTAQAALASVVTERDQISGDLADALARIPATPPLTADDVRRMVAEALANG